MLVRVKGQTLAAMQTPGKVTRNSHNASLLVLTQKKPLSVVCLCTRQGWGTQECECDGSRRQYVFVFCAVPLLYLSDLPDRYSCLPLPCMSTRAVKSQANLIEPTVLYISTRFMASFLNRETTHLLQFLPFPAVHRPFLFLFCFIYLHTGL